MQEGEEEEIPEDDEAFDGSGEEDGEDDHPHAEAATAAAAGAVRAGSGSEDPLAEGSEPDYDDDYEAHDAEEESEHSGDAEASEERSPKQERRHQTEERRKEGGGGEENDAEEDSEEEEEEEEEGEGGAEDERREEQQPEGRAEQAVAEEGRAGELEELTQEPSGDEDGEADQEEAERSEEEEEEDAGPAVGRQPSHVEEEEGDDFGEHSEEGEGEGEEGEAVREARRLSTVPEGPEVEEEDEETDQQKEAGPAEVGAAQEQAEEATVEGEQGDEEVQDPDSAALVESLAKVEVVVEEEPAEGAEEEEQEEPDSDEDYDYMRDDDDELAEGAGEENGESELAQEHDETADEGVAQSSFVADSQEEDYEEDLMLTQALHGGVSRELMDDRRVDFEGKEDVEIVHARLREHAEYIAMKAKTAEVDRFLSMLREHGGGNITMAWRRHFDSDGDGELSFLEFCNALMELGYEGDVLQLWMDLAARNGSGSTKAITLEALDPAGAKFIETFANWAHSNFGGPMELFMKLDKDNSDALTADEFASSLRELGFYEQEDLPAELRNEQLVSENLFPLLDQNGHGTVAAEQMLFLERDREKKKKLLMDLERIRDHGREERDLEPLRNDAQGLLRSALLDTTWLGGERKANHGGPRVAQSLLPMQPLKPVAQPLHLRRRPPPRAASAPQIGPGADGGASGSSAGRLGSAKPRRPTDLPPLRPKLSPHVLDHYAAWGLGGSKVQVLSLRDGKASPGASRAADSARRRSGSAAAPGPPAAAAASEGQAPGSALGQAVPAQPDAAQALGRSRSSSLGGATEKERQRRFCYRQSLVPQLVPTGRSTTSSWSGSVAATSALLTSSHASSWRPAARRREAAIKFDPTICHHFMTSRTQGSLFAHYVGAEVM